MNSLLDRIVSRETIKGFSYTCHIYTITGRYSKRLETTAGDAHLRFCSPSSRQCGGRETYRCGVDLSTRPTTLQRLVSKKQIMASAKRPTRYMVISSGQTEWGLHVSSPMLGIWQCWPDLQACLTLQHLTRNQYRLTTQPLDSEAFRIRQAWVRFIRMVRPILCYNIQRAPYVLQFGAASMSR